MSYKKLVVSLLVLALVLSIVSVTLNVFVSKFATQKKVEQRNSQFQDSNRGNIGFSVEEIYPKGVVDD